MSDALRRLYNALDTLLDRRAITRELVLTRAGGDCREPKTARQAFSSVYPVAREFDRQTRLKLIVSQQGIDGNGASAHWEFFFDLPRRRAQLACEWVLPWDEITDSFGPASIEIAVNPFPPVDSRLRQMVKEGKLLHRQLVGLWKQECRHTTYLPHRFRDTDAVVAEFKRQGLDVTQVEFSLATGASSEGWPAWIAQTRRNDYYAAFVEFGSGA